ncbi:MAG: hypothetical protein V8Q27_05605, partial [Eubacteriales bacterium]
IPSSFITYCSGHKRQLGLFENPYQIDITEIDGFDDLHHPEADGILVRAEERAAKVYGAEETHFLVNGSTAGILSAVSGCTSRGGELPDGTELSSFGVPWSGAAGSASGVSLSTTDRKAGDKRSDFAGGCGKSPGKGERHSGGDNYFAHLRRSLLGCEKHR